MRSSLDQLLLRGWIVAGFFGAAFFFVVAGPGPLDVTNVHWLYHHNDVATAYTGWTFYRSAPWSPRIALNPTYGIDFGGSIIFSDAVPLMAMTFKFLSPLLPETFQYFGLWVFLSFVLQGCFGWLLMKRAVENPVARILGAIIISLTPPYIFRLVSPLAAHMSLTAHWIVLAALCLCLPPHPQRPGLLWGLLLGVTAIVHIYLFAMVATLWCADLARRGTRNFRSAAIEALGIVLFLVALISLTGVWAGPLGEYEGGFGWFKMNVLAFLDPNTWAIKGLPAWSVLLPDIPNWDGDYEGFTYLGLGGLLLVLAAGLVLPSFLRETGLRPVLPYTPLVLVAIGMAIFAISHNATFAAYNFFVPWPSPLEKLGHLFRATGRFVWPIYYLVFYAAVLLISRRLSARALIGLLAVTAAIQAVDIAPGWSSANAYLRERAPPYQSRLSSPFWTEAAHRYKAVRVVPHKNAHARYLDVATMARAHGLVTDAVYLSRSSTPATAASRERVEKGIKTGIWPTNTLFVVDEDIAERASATLDLTRNALVRVDGVIAIAPGWAGCTDCGAAPFVK